MTTEPNALMDMIRPPNLFDRIAKAVSAKSSVSATLGSGVLSQTPWRRAGVKYAQNEIYFDVTESIDCIIGANGAVVSCTVNGVINANCRLSGTPDLTMSFEKSTIMEDASFHPCVRYSRWERDHVVRVMFILFFFDYITEYFTILMIFIMNIIFDMLSFWVLFFI